MKFYYVRGIFDLQDFDNETRALSKFFAICMEMRFVSLKKNERNITKLSFFYTNFQNSFRDKVYYRIGCQTL